MGGGIILVFWLILAGGFIGLWVGAFLLLRYGRKKGSKPLSLFGGISSVLLSLIGLYFIWTIAIGLVRITNPTVIFARSFGFKPTSDVTEIKSSYWYFADTGLTYLKFKASPETLQRIIARGLKETTESNFNNLLASGLSKSAPKWWMPFEGTPSQFFSAERKPETLEHQDFASETEVLSYNPTTGIAYYCFNGID